MVICCVYGCRSRSERKEPGITFHRFPKNPDRCNVWVKNMHLDRMPTINDRICSNHFANNVFYKTAEKIRLLDAAIPTIFLEPIQYLQPKKQQSTIPKCLVKLCQNRKGEANGIHFYSLTKERYKPWMKALERNSSIDELPDNTNIVCEEHFTTDSFLYIKNRKVLTRSALPTLKLKLEAFEEYGKSLKYEMPYCAISTCQKRNGIKHRFPIPSKNMPRFLKWVNICANTLLNKEHMTPEKIYENCWVCHRHFCNADFDPNERLINDPHLNVPGKMVWIKCRTCLEKSNIKYSSRITEECFLGKSYKKIILLFIPQMVTAIGFEDVICFNCAEFLKAFAKFFKRCTAVEEVLKLANEQKKEILRRNEEINEIFGNSSTDSSDENDLSPKFEDCEIIADNNNEVKEVDKRFNIIEEGSLQLYPIKNYDRVVSVTHTNEILAGAIKSNVDVYEYGPHKEEVVNKRILFFGSAIVQCPKCEIVLENGGNLGNHIKTVHCDMEKAEGENNSPMKKQKSSTVHSYPICKINVPSMWLLTKHLRRVHKDYKPHKCEKCGRSFKTKAGRANHDKIYKKFEHCNGRRCYFCSEIVSKEDYSNHRKTHPKSFACGECGSAFTTPHHLQLHYKKHRFKKENRHLCPICGKMSRCLVAHLRTHETGTKKYMCHKCPKFFMTETHLRRHIRRIHLENEFVQCTECKMKFSTPCYLKDHYKLKHSNNYSHTCQLCGKGFARIDNLKRHISNHPSTRRSRQCKYRYASDKLPGPAKCKYCTKQFKTVHKLRTHLLTHIKTLRYKCRFCTLSFSDYSNRYRHEQKHRLSSFELSCKICWKRVESKQELDNHMVKHENSKKYKCEFCGISFARQYLLSHHISENHTTMEDLEKEKEAMLADALEEFLL